MWPWRLETCRTWVPGSGADCEIDRKNTAYDFSNLLLVCFIYWEKVDFMVLLSQIRFNQTNIQLWFITNTSPKQSCLPSLWCFSMEMWWLKVCPGKQSIIKWIINKDYIWDFALSVCAVSSSPSFQLCLEWWKETDRILGWGIYWNKLAFPSTAVVWSYTINFFPLQGARNKTKEIVKRKLHEFWD